MKLKVDEEVSVPSQPPTKINKRDIGGVVKLVSDEWTIERALSVVGRGLGSSMLFAAAPTSRSELEKPSALEIQEACAYLCMLCWEQHPPEDGLGELPDSTEIVVDSRVPPKRKRLSDASAPPSVPSATKSSRSPSQTYHHAPVATITNGGRDSRNFSSSSEPAATPQQQSTQPLAETTEGVIARALVCPVCNGPGRNPTDSHCQGCYTTLWKDARRVATNALDRASPDRWLVGERAADLHRFLVEIQVVGKRCLTGSLNCDASFFSHTRTNKCTRCRSKAAIRLLPALAHRQLCAAFKEIAQELGLNDEPLPAVPPLAAAAAPRGRLPLSPSPLPPAPSSTMVRHHAHSHAPSPVPATAVSATTASAAAAAAATLLAATAAPRRARAVASVTVTGVPSMHAGPAVLGSSAVPPSLLSVPVVLPGHTAHHASLGPTAMLVHPGHMAPAGSGMAPGPVTVAGVGPAGAPSPYPYPLSYGFPHYWVDAHGVAHALAPGLPPGAVAASPSPLHPQGFAYPPGGVSWTPSSSLR